MLLEPEKSAAQATSPAPVRSTGSGIDAETVQGIEAVTAHVAGPNKLVATGSDGFLPASIISGGSIGGVAAGGDLGGTFPNPTVVSVADVTTGVLKIANGGTNSSAALSGSSIAISNGTAIVQGAAGTSTTVLHGNSSGAPTYSAVSLTADVTGTLPVANGGSGNTTGQPSGAAGGDLSGTYPNPTVAKVNGVTVNDPAAGGAGTQVNFFSNATIGAWAIAFDGTNMWTANHNSGNPYTKYTPSGTATNYTTAGVGACAAIAFDGTNMWLPDASNAKLTKVDPSGTATTYTVTHAGQSIAFDGTNMWTADVNTGTVSKIAPSGSVLGTFTVDSGAQPEGLAFDGTNMWTDTQSTGKIYKIDNSGSVTSYHPVIVYQGVTFDGTNLWFTDNNNGNVDIYNTSGTMIHSYPVTGVIGAGTWDGTHMWYRVYNSTTVYRVSTAGVVDTYTSGVAWTGFFADPIGAFDGSNLWFPVDGSNQGVVEISSGLGTVPPSAGMVITATSGTAAIWQNPQLVGGAAGEVVFQSAANTTSFTAAGTSGQVLTSAGTGTPTWTTATSANTASAIVERDSSGNFSAGTITATLSGGATTATTATNLAGGTTGQVPYQSGAGATSFAGPGTATTVLHGNASGAPSYSAVSMTADVSGTLPVANGGTGQTTLTAHDVLVGNSTSAVTLVAPSSTTGIALVSNGTSADPSFGSVSLTVGVSGTLPVASGGTGQASTLTQYGVVYASSTSQMATTAAGTTTTLLHGNAVGSPTFGAVSLTADVSGTLPVGNGGTGQTSYTDGQLLIGNSTGNTLTKATVMGTSNQITVTNGGGSITLSTPQNTDTAATPTFASETLTATTNQLVLGTTRTVTLTAPTPATTSRVVTIPDLSAAYSVVGTEGAQTINGDKTLSGTTNLSGLSASLPLNLDSSKNITAAAISLSGSGVTGTLPVANGGTGDASLTAYAVLCGGTTSTGAVQSIAGVGTSGQVLTSNGAAALPTFQNAGAAPAVPTIQVLTSGTAATYTTPANTRLLWVRMIGGGGGGGGAQGGGSGGNGGSSIFNSVNAAGGTGGGPGSGTYTAGGAGGTGGSGTAKFRIAGGKGDGIINASSSSPAGAGGNGYFGGGGGALPGVANTAGYAGATNSGGGGGGGTNNTNGSGGAGGGAGEYLELLITSPSATYTYTVGAGGTAGTGTQTGGAGGSGIIIVEEYY